MSARSIASYEAEIAELRADLDRTATSNARWQEAYATSVEMHTALLETLFDLARRGR